MRWNPTVCTWCTLLFFKERLRSRYWDPRFWIPRAESRTLNPFSCSSSSLSYVPVLPPSHFLHKIIHRFIRCLHLSSHCIFHKLCLIKDAIFPFWFSSQFGKFQLFAEREGFYYRADLLSDWRGKYRFALNELRCEIRITVRRFRMQGKLKCPIWNWRERFNMDWREWKQIRLTIRICYMVSDHLSTSLVCS